MAEMKDQLHAIWYCIPMDSPRPLLSTELEFFSKGTGNVPLVLIFTKFDALVIQEAVMLYDFEEFEDKWGRARENAHITFKNKYLAKVMSTEYPPKAYVRLEDMHKPKRNCPELTQETANAIDNASLHELFVSTQMNNLNLCVKAALQHILKIGKAPDWNDVTLIVFSKFPHYWVNSLLAS
ncbi:hypothetical protein AX14_006792 [Amanita brunnescens Koide BX004]|nr:hypothetical protein AX14_006792 [Amanita brunnescens Koide BX004]